MCDIVAVTQPFVARAADAPSWPCYQGQNGNFSASECGLTLVDDLKDARLLWKSHEPDSQHGSIHDVLVLGTTADMLKPMFKPWNTPHYDATGYEMPISHPFVSGHLYLRGADGIYCWDLHRK